jgi:hypothetical protein
LIKAFKESADEIEKNAGWYGKEVITGIFNLGLTPNNTLLGLILDP